MVLLVGVGLEPSVDGCIGASIGVVMEDAADDSPPESWRAHEPVVCARLCATLVLVSIFLITEGDGNKTDIAVEVFVERRDYGATYIAAAEDNVADG